MEEVEKEKKKPRQKQRGSNRRGVKSRTNMKRDRAVNKKSSNLILVLFYNVCIQLKTRLKDKIMTKTKQKTKKIMTKTATIKTTILRQNKQ